MEGEGREHPLPPTCKPHLPQHLARQTLPYNSLVPWEGDEVGTSQLNEPSTKRGGWVGVGEAPHLWRECGRMAILMRPIAPPIYRLILRVYVGKRMVGKVDVVWEKTHDDWLAVVVPKP